MPKTIEKIKAKSIDEAIEKASLEDIGKLPEGFEINVKARDEVTVLRDVVKKVKSLPGKLMTRTSSVNRTLSGFRPIRKNLSMITIDSTEFSGQTLTYNNVHYFEPDDYARYAVTYTTDRIKAKGSYTQSIEQKEKSGELTLSEGETKEVTCKKKIKKAQTLNCSAKTSSVEGFFTDSTSQPFDVGLLSYSLAGLDEYPVEGHGNREEPKYIEEYPSVDAMWGKIESTAKKQVKNGFSGIYPEGRIKVLDTVEYGDTLYRVPDNTAKIRFKYRYTYKPKEGQPEKQTMEAREQYFMLWMKYRDGKHNTSLRGRITLPKMTIKAGETTDWYSRTINIPEPFHGELFAQVGPLFLLCETKRLKLGSLVPPGGGGQGSSKTEEEEEEESISETHTRRRRGL